MFDGLLGLVPFVMILTGEEGSQQQDHDADANRRIADVEYQKRPPRTKMQVEEVDDIAVEVRSRMLPSAPPSTIPSATLSARFVSRPIHTPTAIAMAEVNATSIQRPTGLVALRSPSEIPSLWVR